MQDLVQSTEIEMRSERRGNFEKKKKGIIIPVVEIRYSVTNVLPLYVSRAYIIQRASIRRSVGLTCTII